MVPTAGVEEGRGPQGRSLVWSLRCPPLWPPVLGSWSTSQRGVELGRAGLDTRQGHPDCR